MNRVRPSLSERLGAHENVFALGNMRFTEQKIEINRNKTKYIMIEEVTRKCVRIGETRSD